MPATIKDFEDLTTKYYNNEIDWEEYCKLVNERLSNIENKPNINNTSIINKTILGNI